MGSTRLAFTGFCRLLSSTLVVRRRSISCSTVVLQQREIEWIELTATFLIWTLGRPDSEWDEDSLSALRHLVWLNVDGNQLSNIGADVLPHRLVRCHSVCRF